MKVVPGTILSTNPDSIAGPGTIKRKDCIHASLKGTHSTVGLTEIVECERKLHFPKISSIVIGKVTKITPRFANVEILVVGQNALENPIPGIIQQKDVRQTQIDSVEISKCFRPGDIIRAKVIALGDKKSFILSTARNDLGVVLAQSLAGYTMIPVSWEKMVCPKTKFVENRKCAKPEGELELDAEKVGDVDMQ
jgi:exosome complex component CSL4